MLKHLFLHQPIKVDGALEALQQRTRERQIAMRDQMIREGRHVSTKWPVDLRATDVARTFERVRKAMQ